MKLSECLINAIDGNGVISCENAHAIEDAVNFIRKYEDAEENGLLIRLPCKLGDTVYHIVSHTVLVSITGYCIEWKLETTVEPTEFCIWMVDAIGKTIFLTREEADAALKGMKGETEDV